MINKYALYTIHINMIIYSYIYIYIYVCMYVCMYVYIHVYVYNILYVYVCILLLIQICLHVSGTYLKNSYEKIRWFPTIWWTYYKMDQHIS